MFPPSQGCQTCNAEGAHWPIPTNRCPVTLRATSPPAIKVQRFDACPPLMDPTSTKPGPVQRIERIWEDHPTAETKSAHKGLKGGFALYYIKLLACDAFQVHFGLCWGPLFKGPHGWETHSQLVRCSDIAVKFGRTEIQLEITRI